ncbi:hypothetical protein [Actinokineospora pegani]|uniref:hypothetical protein n=1 Tax=Actinokineospora pegani TaxID=2654637 RepID=UPI0012EA5CFC|nr:hypothetical protein [Actinokineospora pegani]
MTDTRSLEEQIAERVQASSLGIAVREPVNGPCQGVYIDNPYSAINPDVEHRFGRSKQHPRPDRTPSPTILKPELTEWEAKAFGYDNAPPPYEERVNAYLQWGADRAVRQPFTGVCESFVCVTMAILMAKNSPLPTGARAEYIGVVQGLMTGHAIVVVNRANATQRTGEAVPSPTAWGDDCFVVDQWYALQAGTSPVLHVAGPHADQAYVSFLTDKTNRTYVCGVFTKDGRRPPIAARRQG